jgi:hypothetical protein
VFSSVADYFAAKGTTQRSLMELPSALLAAGRQAELISLISNIDVFERMARSYPHELFRLWRSANGADPAVSYADSLSPLLDAEANGHGDVVRLLAEFMTQMGQHDSSMYLQDILTQMSVSLSDSAALLDAARLCSEALFVPKAENEGLKGCSRILRLVADAGEKDLFATLTALLAAARTLVEAEGRIVEGEALLIWAVHVAANANADAVTSDVLSVAASVCKFLGVWNMSSKTQAQSLRCLELSHALFERACGVDGPQVANVLRLVGIARKGTKEGEAAMSFARLCISTCAGDVSETTAQYSLDLADLHRAVGATTPAEALEVPYLLTEPTRFVIQVGNEYRKEPGTGAESHVWKVFVRSDHDAQLHRIVRCVMTSTFVG